MGVIDCSACPGLGDAEPARPSVSVRLEICTEVCEPLMSKMRDRPPARMVRMLAPGPEMVRLWVIVSSPFVKEIVCPPVRLLAKLIVSPETELAIAAQRADAAVGIRRYRQRTGGPPHFQFLKKGSEAGP